MKLSRSDQQTIIIITIIIYMKQKNFFFSLKNTSILIKKFTKKKKKIRRKIKIFLLSLHLYSVYGLCMMTRRSNVIKHIHIELQMPVCNNTKCSSFSWMAHQRKECLKSKISFYINLIIIFGRDFTSLLKPKWEEYNFEICS